MYMYTTAAGGSVLVVWIVLHKISVIKYPYAEESEGWSSDA